MSKLVGIAGMIGSGKTTFIQNYSQYLRENFPELRVSCLLEPVEGNKLLNFMYEDPNRWTFTAQVKFLTDKVTSILDTSDADIILMERDYTELLVFIETQYNIGYLKDEEYSLYIELHEILKKTFPDMTNLYLDIPYHVCRDRRNSRGRSCEKLASESYYELLYKNYERYYKETEDDIFYVEDNLSLATFDEITEYLLGGNKIGKN